MAVDIDVSAVHGQHGLTIETALRTVLAVTSYIYTADDSIDILQYTAKRQSLSKVSSTFQVENSMSGSEIAASQQSIHDPNVEICEMDEHSSDTTLRSLVKRTALFLTRVDDTQFLVQNHAAVVDQVSSNPVTCSQDKSGPNRRKDSKLTMCHQCRREVSSVSAFSNGPWIRGCQCLPFRHYQTSLSVDFPQLELSHQHSRFPRSNKSRSYSANDRSIGHGSRCYASGHRHASGTGQA